MFHYSKQLCLLPVFCLRSLNLRQKYVEDAVKGALDQVNPKIFNAPVKFLNYTVDNSGTFPVTSTLQLQSGAFIQVRRYAAFSRS